MPEDIHDLKLEIGLLKGEFEQVSKLTEKISISIEKIQELNVNVLQMLTAHEEKHESQKRYRVTVEGDIKELHSRITTIAREVHDRIDQVPTQLTHVHERIDQIESSINSRIDSLRNDLACHKQADKGKLRINLAEVEKYKWLILGVAVTAAFFLGKLDMSTLLTLVI